jgi:hypothetical protein
MAQEPEWAQGIPAVQPAGNKRRGIGAVDKDIEKVLDIVARQILANTQELRMHAAKLYRTILLSTDLSYYKQGEHYLKVFQTKAAQDQATAGEPYWWIFLGLLMAASSDPKVPEEQKTKVQEVVEEIGKDREKVSEFVDICRLKKAYGEGKKKLLLGWTPKGEEVCRIILGGIVRHGGRLTTGQAPRGANEREIQDWLENRQR